MMRYKLHKILDTAKARYSLNPTGIHGIAHWKRVMENGLKLAEHNGANKDIVQLFALLHDCCRQDDGSDIEHGPRAAEFTRTLRNRLIFAEDEQFEKLTRAIHGHTNELHTDDLDIGTCWDADRLDIGRVFGVKPSRRYLNTDIAKKNWILDWAFKRSCPDG